MNTCSSCHVIEVPSNVAFCDDCEENVNPGAFIAGVHPSQLCPSEVRHLGCTCAVGGVHAATCPTVVI